MLNSGYDDADAGMGMGMGGHGGTPFHGAHDDDAFPHFPFTSPTMGGGMGTCHTHKR